MSSPIAFHKTLPVQRDWDELVRPEHVHSAEA